MKRVLVVLLLVLVIVSVLASELTMILSVTGPHPRNFNPYLSTGPGPNYAAAGFIYETLYYVNNYTGEFIPWLATNYKWSEDFKALTLEIRQAVKWSDGVPFSVDDVLFTYEMLKRFPALDVTGVWRAGLTAVEKVDGKTVRFILSDVNTLFLYNLFGVYIVPKHIWEKVEDPSKFANEEPVGTGAYLLESFTPQVFVLKKNPNYWQAEKIKVEKIRVPAFSGNESAQLAVANGEVDWAGINYPRIENIPNPDIKYWFVGGNPVFVFFNLERAPFNDAKFRKAIAHAIDTDQLIRIAMTNYAVRINPVGIKDGYSYLISEKLKNKWWTYNPQETAKMLEQLGYKKGKDGIYEKDGKKLSYEIIVPAGWTDWIAVCELVSQQLKKIGVEFKTTPIDFGQYLDMIRNKNFDVALSWANYGANPYIFYDNFLNSSNAYKGSNRGGWIDKETDELLAKIKLTDDLTARKVIMERLQEIVLDNVPAVPLFYNPVWFIYSEKNFTGWPNANNAFVEPRTPGMDKIYLVMRLTPKK